MPDPFARPVTVVDEQINGLRALNVDATRQLADIRKRQEALDHDEMQIITAIDGRLRRIDMLLDERLRAEAAERVVTA